VQNIGYGRIGRVLGSRAIERSGDIVCNLHHARGDEEHEFLGGASKPRSTGFSPVWPQIWWRRFSPVWPQNGWWVSWLSLKTKVVEGFLI
jgi:hypothetical protein